MAELDRVKWNAKYEQKLREGFTPTPNETLLHHSSYLTGGTCLDFACGLGGNSIYLAKQGYHVTAIDISDVAIIYLRSEAVQQGLSIVAQQADLSQIQLKEEVYDFINVTYFLDRSLLSPLQKALKTGGLFFMETFSQASGAHPQMNPAYKLKLGELKDVFSQWNIIHFNETGGIQSILAKK